MKMKKGVSNVSDDFIHIIIEASNVNNQLIEASYDCIDYTDTLECTGSNSISSSTQPLAQKRSALRV